MGTYAGQAVFGGTTDPVTGSWNNATALNATVVSSDITGYGVIVASFVTSGSITQGTAIFEISDDGGTTWWPINGLQTGNNSQALSYALTGGSASFEFATGAYNLFRVRLNPVILGAGSVAIRLSAEAFPFTTAIAVAGTVQVSTVSGNNQVRLQDGSGNAITSTASALDINIKSSGATVTVSGTVAATQSGTWNIGTLTTITNAVTVSQGTAANLNATVVGTGTFAVQAAQSGTWTVQQGTPPWTIQGDSASGAAKAGNPVQIGGVFNTTQPTVTTGQTVEAQSTARGAQIVATGADTFNVTVNAALPAGTNVIGHVITDSGSTTVVTGTVAVTQSTSPWVVNMTQVASTTLGTPQTFGTAPTGVVIGTSSDIYVAGTRARSNQTTTAAGVLDVNIVGSLGVTNSVTNGTFIAITDNTTKVGVIAGTTALKTDLSSAGGTAISTGTGASGTGIPRVTVSNDSLLADTAGSAGTLNALNTTATVALNGHNACGMFLAAGTLIGTIIAEVSFDGGTTWVTSYFIDPVSFESSSTIVFAASNTVQSQTILVPGGATNARVRVSAFTSGTATCTLRATQMSNHLAVTIPDRTLTISLTAVAQTASISLEGRTSCGISITSVGTGGTMVVEGSIDGSAWFGIDVWDEGNETWIINPATISAAGNFWSEPIGALAYVRVRVTALTSGTITGTLLASTQVQGTFEYQAKDGTTYPNNLIAVGGKGLDGNVHGLTTDSTGRLLISPSDTVGTTAALNALNATATVVMTGDSSVGLTLNAGTLIGTIVPEVSIDGGTTWSQTFFLDPTTLAYYPFITFAAANGTIQRGILVSGGVSNVRVRVSAFTSGTANATLRATDGAGNVQISSLIDGTKATYRAVSGLFYTLPATPTDTFIMSGSATKTVRVSKIFVQGFGPSNLTFISVSVNRRSTANTGGTTVAITPSKLDTSDPASTVATCQYYTANPTALGTLVAAIDQVKIVAPTAGNAFQPPTEMDFGNIPGSKALVLRGTSDFLAVNLNSQTLPTGGAQFNVIVQFTEE